MAEILNKELFNEAKKYIPGGVNSPVRSFKAVGGYPVFINRAKGSRIYAEDGRRLIDYCLSWGALILGHGYSEVARALIQAVKNGTSFGAATKLEIELAKLIVGAMPSIEQVRLTNSGTEAVMSAVRLARAYTKKNKIIKFEGSYHGHADYLLTKAGSGLATFGIPQCFGVPGDFTKHTMVLSYNNIKEIEKITQRYQKDIAAIIIEPVIANCGIILPISGFLETLREISDKYNIVLIFDEVITGFRLSYGGAQKVFGIRPDLTCLGKIIGGGLPIGAFGGRREIMKLLSPEGDVYQAGTLSGNPIAVTAGITTLKVLKKDSLYESLHKKTKLLCEKIKLNAERFNIKLKINHIGSMFNLFFTAVDVVDFKSANTQNRDLFKRLFHGLLKQGIYFAPSGFEANFLSTAHTSNDIEETSKAIEKVFKNLGGS